MCVRYVAGGSRRQKSNRYIHTVLLKMFLASTLSPPAHLTIEDVVAFPEVSVASAAARGVTGQKLNASDAIIPYKNKYEMPPTPLVQSLPFHQQVGNMNASIATNTDINNNNNDDDNNNAIGVRNANAHTPQYVRCPLDACRTLSHARKKNFVRQTCLNPIKE